MHNTLCAGVVLSLYNQGINIIYYHSAGVCICNSLIYLFHLKTVLVGQRCLICMFESSQQLSSGGGTKPVAEYSVAQQPNYDGHCLADALNITPVTGLYLEIQIFQWES